MTIMRCNQLESGMVLQNDVSDRSGRVLLRRGAKLTKSTLRILKTWGITEVDIRETSSTDQDPTQISEKVLDPSLLQEVREETAQFFIHADLTHPVMKELYDLCSLRNAYAKPNCG